MLFIVDDYQNKNKTCLLDKISSNSRRYIAVLNLENDILKKNLVADNSILLKEIGGIV